MTSTDRHEQDHAGPAPAESPRAESTTALPTNAETTGAVPPRAAQVPTERTHHGHTVTDPYEWLRDGEDPRVLAHLEAENAYTEQVLAPTAALQERVVEEIRSHTAEDDASVPVRLRGWWYFSRVAAGQQYRSYHRAPVVAGRELTAADVTEPVEGEELLLDANAWAAGQEFFRLLNQVVSPDDTKLLVGVDLTGDERYDLRVLDIASGTVLDRSVTDAVSGLAWTADSRAFTYLRADESWRPYQLYLHRLGADAAPSATAGGASGDVLLRQEDDETFWTDAAGSRDGRWIVVSHGSKTTSEVWLFDAADPTREPVLVAERTPGLDYAVEPAGDHLLVLHNRDLTDFELAWASIEAPGDWHRLLASTPGGRLIDVVALEDWAVLECRRDGYADVVALPRERGGGGASGIAYGVPVGLPLQGEVRTVVPGQMPDPSETEVRVLHTSLLTPMTTLAWDPAAGSVRTLHRAPAPNFDPDAYVELRTWATAKDGVRVPISVVHRTDLLVGPDGEPRLDGTLDGTAPGYLYGYGSYEITVDPSFVASRLSLLDRGLVVAYAHIRGGGEMGREWYENGKTLTKRTTFTDFLACADHLAAAGFVDGERLVAEGGSAGGLLIGAAVNIDPARFRAVHAAVPFVDALTTILDPSLPLTAMEWEEWGNPLADREVYEYMASYTPYENIVATQYPAILATTSLNDTRVYFTEPAKWVARLREVTDHDDERPVLLRTEMSAGHGGRSGRYDAWEQTAWEWAWVLDRIGATDVVTSRSPGAGRG